MMWSIFVLLGIEKVRIVPGITASNALDLYYMPYTHSLAGVLCWSALAYVVCQLVPSLRSVRTGLIVAAAVFSHWILDLIVHRHDLALMTASARWDLDCGIIVEQRLRRRRLCCLAAQRCCIELRCIEVGLLDLRFLSSLFRSLGHSSFHHLRAIAGSKHCVGVLHCAGDGGVVGGVAICPNLLCMALHFQIPK
jgi:hypothetical protein